MTITLTITMITLLIHNKWHRVIFYYLSGLNGYAKYGINGADDSGYDDIYEILKFF